MRMERRKMREIRKSIALILVLALILAAGIPSVAQTNGSKTITWDGMKGSDNVDSECGGWHWILTPGGPATLLSGTLEGTVTKEVYNDETGENEDVFIDFEVDGMFHGSAGKGAMHFYVEEGTDEESLEDFTVVNAEVTFTYEGNPRNARLTISNVYCPDERAPRGFISGTKYEIDGDAINAGQGWTIELNNGEMIIEAITDADGYYEFSDLDLDKEYTIRESMSEEQEEEWTQIMPGEEENYEYKVTLSSEEPNSTRNDFENQKEEPEDPLYTISGMKRAVDINLDEIDGAKNGWIVNLYEEVELENNNGVELQGMHERWQFVEYVESGHTGTDGEFKFENLEPGWYKISEEFKEELMDIWVQIAPYEFFVEIDEDGEITVYREEFDASIWSSVIEFTNMRIPHIIITKEFEGEGTDESFDVTFQPVVMGEGEWEADGEPIVRSISEGENIFILADLDYFIWKDFEYYGSLEETAIPAGIYWVNEEFDADMWEEPVYDPDEEVLRFVVPCWDEWYFDGPPNGEFMASEVAMRIPLCYLYPDMTITNEMKEEENGGNGGNGDNGTDGNGSGTSISRTGGGPLPAITTIDDDPIPEGVPVSVPVPDPAIPRDVPEFVLDEEVPLGIPELPQTGEGNPLYFYLAGILLAGTGFILRRRTT